MVSRIESNGSGFWHFARNVMPGEVVGVTDLLPDGGSDAYVISCEDNNLFTQVLKKADGASEYSLEATLSLGDEPFQTTIYSKPLRERIAMRVSHQDKI